MGKTWKDSRASKQGRSKDRPAKMTPYKRSKKLEDEEDGLLASYHILNLSIWWSVPESI